MDLSDPSNWSGSSPTLFYLRARYYDPSTGQFLSRDPAVAMTREPYSYTYDNPLNLTDPSGLDAGVFGWIGQTIENNPIIAAPAVIAAPYVAVLAIAGYVAYDQWQSGNSIATTVGAGEMDPNPNYHYARRDAQFLPGTGEVPFVPQKNKTASDCWSNEKKGFVDRKGRVWQRDQWHTGNTGEGHWDVQDANGKGYKKVNGSGDEVGGS